MKLTHLVTVLTLVAPAAAFAAPKPAEPSMPSADRISPWIKDRVGDVAAVDMRVCVATDGHVMSVKLLQGSSFDAFDRAALKDVAEWKYEPKHVPLCTRTHVEYHTR